VDRTTAPVYIIDGSSFLYRAYYSVKPLTTKDGTSINAVYGFCRMIRKLIDTHQPSYVLLVWDSKGKTVRHDMYAAYKETRQAMPNDLAHQKTLIQEFAATIGIQQLAVPAIEADDLMFSVAKRLEEQGHESIVLSSDKDLGQVLSEKVTILDPFKEERITRESLEQKLGFPLYKLPFYFALVGDSSDNIPGVAGIGPKGATQLVQNFESLEDLYEKLETISSERTRSLLSASKEHAFLSQKLFILQRYETPSDKELFKFSQESWAQAYPLFEKYGFKSLLGESSAPQREVTLHTKYAFSCVTTHEALNSLAEQIKQAGRCALDTECTGLNPLQSELVGISVCVEEGAAYYIPVGHKTAESQLSREEVVAILKPLLEDPSIEKYLHHTKFDALMLSTVGIHLVGVTYDTLLAASLGLGDTESIGLKSLSEKYLQEPMLSFKEVVAAHKYPDFSYVPLAPATEYAAADAHQTMRLVPVMKQLLDEKGLAAPVVDLEMSILDVLTTMEKKGILLDTNLLEDINTKVTHDIEVVKVQVHDLIGSDFAELNLNSPKQLGVLLFEHLKLPVMKKTAGKTGYSTDQEVLEQLAQYHPVPAMIIKYRELTKIKSTYLDALAGNVHPQTKAIHTTYSQTTAATGRLASSDPNLQNIPVDTFKIRSAFIPREGHIFLSADYSQIELRVLAHVSQDETLLQAFRERKDIHMLTAAGLFSLAPEQVTQEQRQIGKRINFSILYGLTAHGLSKDLGISHSTAKSYIDTFMAQYPGVVAWMQSVIDYTQEKGYVETVFGRRRYMPGIYERNRVLFDLARRAAINTVAQGTAAELMKRGMVDLAAAFQREKVDAHMLLQIHDELLIEVPLQQVEKVESIVKSTLESVVSWDIPLEVTTRMGKNWQEVTK
jgi:DNA polymerase-1